MICVFQTGRAVNIDDLIFTYYVFLDPSYTGSSTLASYPILGLRDYQTRTPPRFTKNTRAP
jgi:peptide/nickel transport system substrate-binding protein